MLLFDGAAGLVVLVVWVFCLLDVITTPEEQCRNLPKLAWLLLVLLLSVVGSVVWLVAGRPQPAGRPGGLPYKGNTGLPGPRPPVVRRPPGRPVAPDDDESFLRGLRERAEEQRRRGRRDGDDPG